MEPVVVLSGRRNRETDIDWDECFICQRSIYAHKTVKPTDAGLKRFQECVRQRQKYHDSEYIDTIDRLNSVDLGSITDRITWHRTCYSQFTHAHHIKRLQSRYDSECLANAKECPERCTDSPSDMQQQYSRPTSRSSLSKISWESCIFCQKAQKCGPKLRNVATLETSEKILQMAKEDAVLRYRLAGVNDLIAAEGKYHLQCYTACMRKYKPQATNQTSDICFNNLIQEVEEGLIRGNIYTMSTIWKRYQEMVCISTDCTEKETGQNVRKTFTKKIKKVLKGRAEFVQSLDPNESQLVFPVMQVGMAVQNFREMADQINKNEEENISYFEASNTEEEKDIELLSWLYRVSIKIKSDINTTKGHEGIGNINIESAERVVPESLYLFLRLLCGGDDDDFTEDNNETSECIDGRRVKLLSIAQDIVALASDGKKQTTKQLGLGLAIHHQSTRSKDLVQLLHAAGHTVSYEAVRRADIALASAVLQRYATQNNTIIPLNFTSTQFHGYIRYANDNIDILEETLDGKGTFHASQTAAFRRGVTGESSPEVHVQETSCRSIRVPEDFMDIQPSGIANHRPEPLFSEEVKVDWYMEKNSSVDLEAKLTDMAWVLARLAKHDGQYVPGWTIFNQMITEMNPVKTVVGPMPIIPEPAHEFDTVWTVIHNCQKMTAALGQKYTVLTFDEQLYCKAKMLQWFRSEECKNLVVMLGGFHIQMNFTKVVGQYVADAGLKDILVESGVYGENTAQNVIDGKQWNRTVRAHKLIYEALWRLLWKRLQDWLKENQIILETQVTQLANELALAFQAGNNESIQLALKQAMPVLKQLDVLLEEFDRSREFNGTYTYWRQYMYLISILLRFTRAIRDSNWQLYLHSFAEMLPWFAAFDHVNYLRWGSIFLADMKQLEHTAPEVLTGFKSGDFTVKETNKKFNQLPDDQGLEHVNKMGKVAGGLVGITRTESARNRWGLTYIDRARLADDTRSMLGVKEDEEETPHTEAGKSRIERDERDVETLVTFFERFSVFDKRTDELVCLSTGDIATEAIATDMQNVGKVGRHVVRSFVSERLVDKSKSFHVSHPKLKLKTFASLFNVDLPSEKQKKISRTIKADRDLFQRLIVAMESGREINVDSLLKREICHVPLALASTDGTLRTANKSQLLHILEHDNVSFPALPESSTPTCVIIDGMSLVQALGKSQDIKTFRDYSERFVDAVNVSFKEPCTRVDVVFDCYEKQSIKDGTRRRRAGGKGIRCEVSNKDLMLPVQWKSFISVNENKAALSRLLKEELLQTPLDNNKEIIVSGGNNGMAASSSGRNVDHLDSSQEEADTRIILHAIESKANGYERIVIAGNDTDILLLLLAFTPQLPKEIWMKTGTNKSRRFIAIHKIECTDEVRDSLLGFHAITGCDSTSQLAGISKKSAWKTFVQVPNLLSQLGVSHYPNEEVVKKAEEFICRLYSSTEDLTDIHALRCAHFRKRKGKPENLPPTKDALHQHILRSHHQALVWKNANVPFPDLPSPATCGWKLEQGQLKPILMTQEGLSAECVDVTLCSCSRNGRLCRTGQCSCKRSSLKCTKACKCEDWCRNPYNEHD